MILPSRHGGSPDCVPRVRKGALRQGREVVPTGDPPQSLASCVAETVMTGLLGGGHATYFDAGTGRARNLDCFVAVPGLGEPRRETTGMLELQVPFGTELVHYAVGIASCGVPGLA